MKKIIIFISACIFISINFAHAGVTYLQYFYSVKQIMSDVKEVHVLITQDRFEKDEQRLVSSGAKIGLKIFCYVINNVRELGEQLAKVPENGVLVVLDDPLFNDKKSRIYILSKAKERNISVVSASKEYSDAGALIGLLPNAQGKIEIVINLKFYPALASKFTPEFNEQVGITQVLQ